MTPSLRREEPPAPSSAWLRCPACGRRIAGSCPVDGPPSRAEAPPSSRAPTLAPPSIPGHRVTRLLARGGFGLVFEGTRESDGARVAIKVARADRADAAACLEQEIVALTTIGAPHVPTVLARGETEGSAPYVVMDLLTAPTLAERLLGRVDPLPVAEAIAVVLALLDAVERVHACGYVHRDLKPENVFVDAARRATLVDFGLASRIGGGSSRDVTSEGMGVGTAEYMAPEQCEGQHELDGRADLYAVGVMLFELCVCRPPFWGPRALVKESHLSRRPPRMAALAGGRAIPAALEDIVARCLAKDPRDRFLDVAALRGALLAVPRTGEGPSGASSRSPPRTSSTPSSQGRSDRATVGLLFFETALDVAAVKARLGVLGGHVGEIAGGRCVGVFTESSGDNPARRAHRAAEELIRLGVCERARVDLAAVAARLRRDGTRVFLSPLFTRVDRFPSAHDPDGVSVTAAAADLVGDVGAARTSIPPPPSRRPESFANGVEAWPFVGREVLLTTLVESARTTIEDSAPTITSVIADAGQGKSHLARVLVERLIDLGGTLLTIRAPEPALGDADRALADLLARALDLPAEPPPDGGAALLAERLGPGGAELAPAVALALGWITATDVSSPLGSALRAQGAAPGALRSALTVAAGEALRRRAAHWPLLVIVDDAQFAGDVVLSALEYAARADAHVPLWVCVLGRPLALIEQPGWGQNAARREHHRLGPLDLRSAAVLCRRLLFPVESLPDSVVQRLVTRTKGNPLLLVELVRGLHRERIVRKSARGEAWYLAADELDRLPDSPLVEWLARRELDALAPALAGHARLLALLGERVSIDEIEGLLRHLEWQGGDIEFPLDAKIGTRRLIGARVVVEDAAGRIEFRNGLVREAVARAVPEAQRRRIHAAAAEYYGREPGALSEDHRLAQLAYHAGEAGLPTEAAQSYLALAERARARHVYTDAERLYSRALAEPAPSLAIDRRSAHRGRGLMRYRMGRYDDALADFSEARRLAAEAGDVAEQIAILLDEATALDWMDAYKASRDRVESARALLPSAPSPLLDARLLLGLGRSAFRQSRNAEAAGLLERAVAAAAPLGDDGYETRVIALIQLGFLLSGLGRPDDAERVLDEVVTLAEEHGDRLHLGSALNVRAMLWGNLGRKARLVADMERSLAIAVELGQTSLELMGEFNLAEFLLFMDDAPAAELHVRRAAALDRCISGDAGRADVALLEARLRLYGGDVDAAAAIVAHLREREEAARARGEALLVPSDEVLCAMIDLSVRDADGAAWDALETRAEQSVAQERLEVIEARGLAAERHGRPAEAMAHFERALVLALQSPNAMGMRLARRLVAAAALR
ncbi:serine/threonine protein kinase [Minicystis rosea]|nr:serine/threonine protein kinase [Minicystis rosea]